MSIVRYEQSNFTKGMIGKSLQNRTDLEIYNSSVYQLVNYIVTGQGTLKNRTVGLNKVEVHPALLSILNEQTSYVIINKPLLNTTTVFVEGQTQSKAFTFLGTPITANLINEHTFSERYSFLFAISSDIYLRTLNGELKKIEWDFYSSENIEDVFKHPPVKLETTRISEVEGIGDIVSKGDIAYRNDPRQSYFEIDFAQPIPAGVSITKLKFTWNIWKKKGTIYTDRLSVDSYTAVDAFLDTTKRFNYDGTIVREFNLGTPITSIKRIRHWGDNDCDSDGGVELSVDYFNSVDGKWYRALNRAWVKTSSYALKTFDNLGVNAPVAGSPNIADVNKFFNTNLFEVDMSGSRGRFVEAYVPSAEGSPITPWIRARFESIIEGINTLETDYSGTTPQNKVVWIKSQAKFAFARERFTEVERANIFTFYQNRLVIAGIPDYEDTIVMSALNDFKDFSISGVGTDPITLRLSSDRGQVVINGFSEMQSLLVYTNLGIYSAPPKEQFTASTAKFDYFNSLLVDPANSIRLSDMTVVGGINKDRIYAIKYNEDNRSYTVIDLNIINSTILKGLYSMLALKEEGQSEFTLLALFCEDGIKVLNLDLNENIQAYSLCDTVVPNTFKDKVNFNGVDYVWFEDGFYSGEFIKAARSALRLLIPNIETADGMCKYDETAKIDRVYMNIIGDYNFKSGTLGYNLEPAIENETYDNIDYDSSKLIKLFTIDNIPVNTKLSIENDMREFEVVDGEINDHEITSIMLEISTNKSRR